MRHGRARWRVASLGGYGAGQGRRGMQGIAGKAQRCGEVKRHSVRDQPVLDVLGGTSTKSTLDRVEACDVDVDQAERLGLRGAACSPPHVERNAMRHEHPRALPIGAPVAFHSGFSALSLQATRRSAIASDAAATRSRCTVILHKRINTVRCCRRVLDLCIESS